MNTEEKVISIIRGNTEGTTEVSLGTDLRRELRLDSFGTLMLINAMEETFGISMEDTDFTGLKTVADVVQLLRSKYHCA